MLSATTSGLGDNADHVEPSPSPVPFKTSTTYSCAACHISFQNGQDQRTHMKEPWQYVDVMIMMYISS